MDGNILKEIKYLTKIIKLEAEELELTVQAFMDGNNVSENELQEAYTTLNARMEQLNKLWNS